MKNYHIQKKSKKHLCLIGIARILRYIKVQKNV